MNQHVWIYLVCFIPCLLPGGGAERVLGEETEEFDFDGLPGAQHEFKVEVPAGREECFYQKVVRGGKMHISFECMHKTRWRLCITGWITNTDKFAPLQVLRGGNMDLRLGLRNPALRGYALKHTDIDIRGGFEYQVEDTGNTAFTNLKYRVLKGGDSTIQLLVYTPKHELMFDSGQTARAGFEPELTEIGPYAICLDNTFSRMASKLVYVYIVTFVDSEWEQYHKELEEVSLTVHNFTESIHQVEQSLNDALVHQAQSRMHVIKDWYLITGNNNYIQRWSLAQCCVIVISTCFQVYFVRRLFRYTNVKPSKPRA